MWVSTNEVKTPLKDQRTFFLVRNSHDMWKEQISNERHSSRSVFSILGRLRKFNTRWIFDAYITTRRKNNLRWTLSSRRNRKEMRETKETDSRLFNARWSDQQRDVLNVPRGVRWEFFKNEKFCAFFWAVLILGFLNPKAVTCLGDTKKRASFTRARVFLSFSACVYDKNRALWSCFSQTSRLLSFDT